jgi:ABC-type uncharacterized transport system involved in gliding motility auxiliary subunit
LTQESVDIVKSLDKPVTIYALARTGEEDNMLSDYVGALTFSRLLKEYESKSPNVKVEYRDPYMLPGFTEQFATDEEGIPPDSVIVQSGEKFKVIKPEEMFTTAYDQNYQMYVASIEIEPNISNAINYVTSPTSSILYTITGSNETALSESLKRQIGLANYDIKEVNLTASDVPEDCTMLLATQPTRDWTEEEAKKVLAYLQNDGRAIFLIGYYGTDLPNMASVLQNYGVDFGKYIVIEGNASNYIINNPMYVLPTMKTHAITDSLTKSEYMPLMVRSSGIEPYDVKKSSTTIEPLLVSSSKAYGKTNLKSVVQAKETTDVSGPFNMAVAITDSVYTNEQHTTKMVVAGADTMLDESINSAMGGGNWKFLINCLNWLQDKDNTIYIAPKTPEEQKTLSMTSGQSFAYAIICVLVLPGLILAAGFYVWLVRRRAS